MSELSSTPKEKLQQKLKITQASLEGTLSVLNNYNKNDESGAGLFWAFQELKSAIRAYLRQQE